jgi:hypothetical protein
MERWGGCDFGGERNQAEMEWNQRCLLCFFRRGKKKKENEMERRLWALFPYVAGHLSISLLEYRVQERQEFWVLLIGWFDSIFFHKRGFYSVWSLLGGSLWLVISNLIMVALVLHKSAHPLDLLWSISWPTEVGNSKLALGVQTCEVKDSVHVPTKLNFFLIWVY